MTKKIDILSLTPFSQTTFDVALISSAGGAGHKIAALAIKSAHPGDCYEINTFGTLGKIGKACTNSWDKAQKQGNVKKQIKLAKRQGFAEALFSVPIYFRICYVLLRYDIDKIIDTQAIGTRPIVRAARTVNFIYRLFRKKKVITVWKIFIELPNAKSLYYHRYIKKLSKKDKKIFKFISINPSLKTSEEEENFWKKFCNLSLMKGEIVYADSPIRKEFLAYKDCPPKPNELAIAINTEEELTILRSLHDELGPCINPDSPQKLLHIPVKSDDIVMTLMLGSQVAEKATFNYVSSVLKLEEIAKTKNKKIYFFVFCNKHIPQQETLFKKVADLIKSQQCENPHIKIIPLTFQNASEIASLMYRSDIAIIRTGAQASHEVKNVVQGQILIHSEATNSSGDQMELLKGIPLWEGGNAQFLIENHQAKIVNPDILKNHLEDYLLERFDDHYLA